MIQATCTLNYIIALFQNPMLDGNLNQRSFTPNQSEIGIRSDLI